MLTVTFKDVLDELGPDAAFRIANTARPGSDYLWSRWLPERARGTYQAKAGTMTVRTTMAPMVGMDSPYPEVGLVEAGVFSEEAIKIAGVSHLTEENLRQIQELLRDLQLGGGSSKDALLSEVFNFAQKVLVQSMMDRTEWMRGQALVNGAINWTFGKMTWNVDYGRPSANVVAQKTGTAAWDSTASEFWDSIAKLYQALRYEVSAFVVHPDTLLKITSNAANNLEIVAQEMFAAGGSRVTVRRLLGSNERPSSDFRETVTLISYGDEGEILDLSNPGQTTKVPFMPTKTIVAIGRGTSRGYVVGQGATTDPRDEFTLGYTHLAPTVEGNLRPGRWAQVYTPERLPMQLHGRFASNVVPVIENPELIAIATSEIDGA